MHEPDVEKLKHGLTYEQWCKWEQFYEQDPWGDLREDMRAAAMWLMSHGGEDVRPFFPYFGSDEAEQKSDAPPIDMDEVMQRLAKAKAEHYEKKQKKADG